MAGGLGTRLRPLTDRLPKCLVPVCGKPLLSYWQERLTAAGIRDAWINLHAHSEQVQAWISQQGDPGPVQWHTFEEPELLGSAGTVRALLPQLEESEDFLIIYADNLSEIDLRAMIASHRSRGAEFTMALFEAPEPRSCGIATLEADGSISHFIEKPERPRSNLANAGVYAASRGVLGPLLAPGFSDLAYDVLPKLSGRMHGFRIAGYHRDVGTPASLAAIEADVARARATGTIGKEGAP